MKKLIRKGLASACFVALGAVAYSFSKDKDFAFLILLGLIFGFVGDIVIDVHYIIPSLKKYRLVMGSGAFLAGHGLYLAAIITRSQSIWLAALIGAAVMGIVCFFLQRLLIEDIPFFAVGIIYLLVVGVLAALGVNYMFESSMSTGSRMLSIGLLLFAASDVFLIYRNFGRRHFKGMRAFCLTLYYAGQLLIAASLFGG